MTGEAGEGLGPFDSPSARTFRCPSCGAPASEKERACAWCGSLLSTRRCVACFALNSRDSRRCGRCGATLPREVLGPDAGGNRCPDCGIPLSAHTAGVIGYAECARCGGLFLKNEAFEAVTRDADVRARVRAVEPAPAHKDASLSPRFHYRPCPSCRGLMLRTNYGGGSGIILDACRDHGVWFDRGELTAIVDFLENGGWERVRKRERDRLNEEVAALETRSRNSEPGGYFGPAAQEPLDFVGDALSWLSSLVFRKKG
jgi:Zn-finger nucleic acid-binding protein